MHEVMYADDMRMRQFEAALCLALELMKRRTILNHEVGKKFQRDIALQFFIPRQPDYSHSASPEDLDQRVAVKHDLAAGSVERRLEKATGAAALRRISWDFGSTLSANSDCTVHGCFYWQSFWKLGFMPERLRARLSC
jgi:hypothetical protein